MDEYDEMLSAARYKAERDVALQELDRLKRNTCRVQTRVKRISQTQTMVTKLCSECGHVFGSEQHREYPFEVVLDEIELPNYCPNCGGKVVEP